MGQRRNKQTSLQKGDDMIINPVVRGRDGIYCISGSINGRKWVAYGTTPDEAREHGKISRKVLLRTVLGEDNDREQH